MGEWRELGRVCRLQIQQSSLKVGPPKGKYYDPAPVRSVDALTLTADGAEVHENGSVTLDIHNATHPDSKNLKGVNDISIGFTGHYGCMRERFGVHLTDGIAGENILVEHRDRVALDDVAGGLLITGDDGRRVELSAVRVAHPCVEFSRFALDDPLAPPAQVSETLKFLDAGLRGFYAGLPDGVVVQVREGDVVWGRVAE